LISHKGNTDLRRVRAYESILYAFANKFLRGKDLERVKGDHRMGKCLKKL
jgi:hypothetical protein